MNCKSVQSRLSAYIDRELTGHELLSIRDHLRDCTDCRIEENAVREFKCLLGGLTEIEPPAGFADRLCASVIRSAPAPQPAFSWRRSFFTFGAVAACSMAVTFYVISPKPVAPVVQAPVKDNVKYDVMQDQAYSIGYDATSGTPVSSVSNYGR